MRPAVSIQAASYSSAAPIAGAFSAISETFNSGYGAFVVPPDTGDYGSPDFYKIAATDGKLQIAATSARPSLKTAASYTLLGNSIYVCILPPMLAAPSDNDVEFIINSSTSGTRLVMRINRNTPRISFTNEVSSADSTPVRIPFNSATMQYLRFREAAGTVYYETSANGSSWTTQRSISTPAWLTSTANQSCEFTAHTASGGGGQTDFGLFEIQSVNTVESISDPLATWHTALSNVATAQARVVFIGDSVVEGNGATSRNTSCLHYLVSRLLASYPVSGMGRCEYFPQHYYGPSWHHWDDSRSGTISEDDFGLGLGCRSANMSTGAILNYTVVGTDIDIWTAAGGSCAVAIDGGSYGTPFSASNAYGEITQISLGASGSHTVSVKAVTGTLPFLGMTVYDGGRDKGIVLYDYTRSGAACLTFYDLNGVVHGFANELPRYIGLINPHLVIIKLQGNDAGSRTSSQYAGDLRDLRNAVEAAAPSASIMFLGAGAEDPTGPDDTLGGVLPSPWHEYFDAMGTVAAEHGQKNARLVPPMPRATNAPGFYVDNNHYTDVGHAWFADFVQYHIDPLYAPLPAMTLTGTLPGGIISVPYSATLSVGGYYVEGITPGLDTGSLPSWMTATYNTGAATITYAGTPSATGTTNFTPKATDSSGTPQVAIGPAQSVVISASQVGVVQSVGEKSAQPSGTGNAYTFTPAAPFTSGNKVIVCFSVYDDNSITMSSHCTVTINGTTATLVAEKLNDSFALAMYYGTAGSGSAGVTITFDTSPYSGGGVYIVASAIECDDIASLDSGSVATAGTTTNNDPKVTSGALSNANERLVTFIGTGNNQSVTVTTTAGTDTDVYHEPNGSSACPSTMAYRNNSGTSGQLVDWAASASTKWAMIVAGFVKS